MVEDQAQVSFNECVVQLKVVCCDQAPTGNLKDFAGAYYLTAEDCQNTDEKRVSVDKCLNETNTSWRRATLNSGCCLYQANNKKEINKIPLQQCMALSGSLVDYAEDTANCPSVSGYTNLRPSAPASGDDAPSPDSIPKSRRCTDMITADEPSSLTRLSNKCPDSLVCLNTKQMVGCDGTGHISASSSDGAISWLCKKNDKIASDCCGGQDPLATTVPAACKTLR